MMGWFQVGRQKSGRKIQKDYTRCERLGKEVKVCEK